MGTERTRESCVLAWKAVPDAARFHVPRLTLKSGISPVWTEVVRTVSRPEKYLSLTYRQEADRLNFRCKGHGCAGTDEQLHRGAVSGRDDARTAQHPRIRGGPGRASTRHRIPGPHRRQARESRLGPSCSRSRGPLRDTRLLAGTRPPRRTPKTGSAPSTASKSPATPTRSGRPAFPQRTRGTSSSPSPQTARNWLLSSLRVSPRPYLRQTDATGPASAGPVISLSPALSGAAEPHTGR